MKNHYSKPQWLQYKKNQLPPVLQQSMEDHLVKCDACLSTYLSLIDDQEIMRAAELLSPDFSLRVMNQVAAAPKPLPPKTKITGERRKNLLIYYAAAASITLFFVGSGIFQGLVETGQEAAEITARIRGESKKSVSLDWPDKVVNRAAQWIENFEGQRRL